MLYFIACMQLRIRMHMHMFSHAHADPTWTPRTHPFSMDSKNCGPNRPVDQYKTRAFVPLSMLLCYEHARSKQYLRQPAQNAACLPTCLATWPMEMPRGHLEGLPPPLQATPAADTTAMPPHTGATRMEKSRSSHPLCTPAVRAGCGSIHFLDAP